ncbi:uncharacterized protein LOC6564139 isoform X2 [Drosophila grimshawi]|uniref:uncharacterized protein LOC6564139 isoform X2 n=1 Tax=Drosophila grimshawi TaxID=7222 RepID=UPI000C870DF4|nr:uncharacterized protein LOC6564139 isoform X2 [Drosophila grimshawi]
MELIKKYKQGKLTTGDIRLLNHIVICLMVLVATFSIIWSVSLHLLSGDFYDGFISAKIMFKERDHIDNRSNEIGNKYFEKVGQLLYVSKEALQSPEIESPTQKSKYKIAHIYEPKESDLRLTHLISDHEPKLNALQQTTTTSEPPNNVFNAEADRKFLNKSIDIHATRWSHGLGAQFVYAFPLISEVVAIIWTAMCIIFQTGNKKTSVLPKPWRIVVPSILIFTLMSLLSACYTILTDAYLKRLCLNLRQGLSNPLAISCGDAIAVLRPYMHEHSVSHDAYLDIFRFSYVISMTLWILALLVMVLRCAFAVDFQLVDIDDMFDGRRAHMQPIQPVYTEVLQTSPQHKQQARPKSEEDYQSAKSRLSDLAVPLLELKAPEQQQTEQQQQMHLTTVA